MCNTLSLKHGVQMARAVSFGRFLPHSQISGARTAPWQSGTNSVPSLTAW